MYSLRKLLLVLVSTLFIFTGRSQRIDLPVYAGEQQQLQQRGMYVLAGWAGVNLISGAYLAGRTTGTARHFHRMNLYWNVVNGTLAGVALWRLHHEKGPETWSGIYKRQQRLEKLFLFNSGLDLAYVATGVYLNEKSRRGGRRAEQWKGFGNSLVVQGGFLLLFDGMMYGLLHRKAGKLAPILDQVQLGTDGYGLSAVIRL